MTALHIISGILLILACLAIVLVVLFTDTNNSGLNSAFGGNADTFFGRNTKNTREAKLDKVTKICVGIFFVVTILVNVVSAILG